MKLAITVMTAAVLMMGAASAAGADATEQKLMDIETATAKAFMQADTAAMSGILADDWMVQEASGRHNRAEMLAEMKSGKYKVTSMTNHDMHARVMGNVAFVQGMEDEKSTYGGEDTSGTYSWTDVFEMRGGKWVAVATQVTKVH